jgi:hypothetical protein
MAIVEAANATFAPRSYPISPSFLWHFWYNSPKS